MLNERFFSEKLMRWNIEANNRVMPWKGEKDPYKIWLSEVILQQTRVEQGLKYYNAFIRAFPTVKSLATASDDKIYKLWEGLGYYIRCKNLISTARYVYQELNGKFPPNYDGLLELKGVGGYTAAAIASFAYNEPRAVTDGNVYRVLARFFGIGSPIDNPAGKKIFSKLANDILDKNNPALHNQAIMDFGAIICKPRNPLCSNCPINNNCYAFKNDVVEELPVKEKRMIRRKRWIYYLVIEYDRKLYTRKRTASDIWENLHDFVPIETRKEVKIPSLFKSRQFLKLFTTGSYEVLHVSSIFRQQLTHQDIAGQFISIKTQRPLKLENYMLLSQKELSQLAFPKFINTYLKD